MDTLVWGYSCILLYLWSLASTKKAKFPNFEAPQVQMKGICIPCAKIALSQRCHNCPQLTCTCMLFGTVPKQVLFAEIAFIFSEKAQKVANIAIGELLCIKPPKGAEVQRQQTRVHSSHFTQFCMYTCRYTCR